MNQGADQALQAAFAAHIRDPGRYPAPQGVDPERMKVYRELFFNNIQSFLATGFPVLQAILSGPRWIQLVRDFFSEHQAKTPLFVEIAGEFVAYLETERVHRQDDLPFLAALAHYEWVELVLSVREADSPVIDSAFLGDPLSFCPRLSPLAWLLTYPYPVHRIGPDFQPGIDEQEEAHLLVYRGRDEEVHFLELNAVTYGLIEALREKPSTTLAEILERIARNIGHPNPDSVVKFGASLIRDLHEKGVIGTQ